MSFNAITGVGEARIRIDKTIADTLMRSSVVVEIAIDVNGVSQAAITDKPESVQAFGLERQEKSFDVRITVGGPWRGADDFDAGAAQHVIEASLAELTAAVMDEVGYVMLGEKAGVGHGESACDLLHDSAVGMHGDDAAVNTARGNMHHDTDHGWLPSGQREHGNGSEIDAGKGLPVGGEKGSPVDTVFLALRCRLDAVCEQDASDRRTRDWVSESGHHPNESAVAPDILAREAHDQIAHKAGNRLSSAALFGFCFRRASWRASHQLAKPAAQGVGGSDATQGSGGGFPAQRLGEFRKLTPVDLGEVPQGLGQQAQQDADERALQDDGGAQGLHLGSSIASDDEGEHRQ